MQGITTCDDKIEYCSNHGLILKHKGDEFKGDGSELPTIQRNATGIIELNGTDISKGKDSNG